MGGAPVRKRSGFADVQAPPTFAMAATFFQNARKWGRADSLTYTGRVVETRAEDDEGVVECELAVRNQDGEAAITGAAVAVLPIREM